jgi:flagellar FliL protein
MAEEKEKELELDVNQPKSSKVTMILLIVLIVLVLVMGGVGAWLYLSADDSGESGSAENKSEKKEETALVPLNYLTMVPEFVVNFGPGSKVRYLQVDLQISTRDEAALKTVSTYRPVLRNDILVVLSGVNFDDLKDRNGKERLQKKLLNTINKVIVSAGQTVSKDEESAEATNEVSTENTAQDGTIKGPIENVYFTSFIMQ